MVAASPIEVAYADAFHAVDVNGQSTWSFGGRNFGTVLPGRQMVLFVWGGNWTVSAVTIGGVAATQVWSSGNYSVWIAPEASAGSGTVAITTTTTSFYLYAVLHAVYGLSAQTITAVTPVSGNPAATSFDVPWGSAAFAIGHRGAVASATWTGLAEGADAVLTVNITSNYTYSSGCANFPDGATGHSISVNMGGACSLYPFILSH
jgi:hypothetical protein